MVNGFSPERGGWRGGGNLCLVHGGLNAGSDKEVQPEHHDRRRHRGVGARDHGREGADRNRGTALDTGVPQGGLPRDTAGLLAGGSRARGGRGAREAEERGAERIEAAAVGQANQRASIWNITTVTSTVVPMIASTSITKRAVEWRTTRCWRRSNERRAAAARRRSRRARSSTVSSRKAASNCESDCLMRMERCDPTTARSAESRLKKRSRRSRPPGRP